MKLNPAARLAVVLGLFATGAFAAETSAPATEASEAAPAFETLDRNTDGAISSDEAKHSWLESAFQDADANKDGNVSKVEYEDAESES